MVFWNCRACCPPAFWRPQTLQLSHGNPKRNRKKIYFLLKIRESRGNQIWGVGGSGGAISIVNIIKRLAQKLRRIILLHFGLVTFRFHYGGTLKPVIFMIFGWRQWLLWLDGYINVRPVALLPSSLLAASNLAPLSHKTQKVKPPMISYRIIHMLMSCDI